MYDRIEDMNLKIENLESALLASTSGQILSDKDQQVVIQARDNNINSMLRAVMYSLMAISNQDTSVLPDPVFKNSGGASVFWVPTGIPDEEALRPNFNVSWTKNKPWHSQFLAKVRSDGNSLYPSCSTDVIAGLQDKDILTRGSRTTFKHLKEKYQVQGKSDRERDLDKQFKRRDGRKKIKATTRSAVREQYPSLEDSRYDFIFHTAFQSTDCSTDLTSKSEGDNDLDDDDTPKIKTLKSWPPEYRDQNYLDLIDDIDVRSKSFATSEKTSKKTSKNTKRSSGYVYLRAKQKKRSTTSIPRPEHGPKMLCCFIEEKWLEKQPERNRKEMGKFVLGSDDEGYDEDWEVFPSWEKFNKKGKGKQK
ncbi:hypothetical protein B0H13DRAFT_2356871 [Mycena leptocephala]|nr:hypothetical protein B0H13DRAFT_2356871 [Mycena leptocephala]